MPVIFISQAEATLLLRDAGTDGERYSPAALRAIWGEPLESHLRQLFNAPTLVINIMPAGGQTFGEARATPVDLIHRIEQDAQRQGLTPPPNWSASMSSIAASNRLCERVIYDSAVVLDVNADKNWPGWTEEKMQELEDEIQRPLHGDVVAQCLGMNDSTTQCVSDMIRRWREARESNPNTDPNRVWSRTIFTLEEVLCILHRVAKTDTLGFLSADFDYAIFRGLFQRLSQQGTHGASAIIEISNLKSCRVMERVDRGKFLSHDVGPRFLLELAEKEDACDDALHRALAQHALHHPEKETRLAGIKALGQIREKGRAPKDDTDAPSVSLFPRRRIV